MLQIEAAMINPLGKSDWLTQSPPNELLNREWVQIRNTATLPITLDGVELHHMTYPPGKEPKRALVFRLTGKLGEFAALRIHSGKGDPYLDKDLMIIHTFINPQRRSFHYQIMKQDQLFLIKGGQVLDSASYKVPLPPNKRLKRVHPPERRELQPV